VIYFVRTNKVWGMVMEAENVVQIRTLRDINEILSEHNIQPIDNVEHQRFRRHTECSAKLRDAVSVLAKAENASDKVQAVKLIVALREEVLKREREQDAANQEMAPEQIGKVRSLLEENADQRSQRRAVGGSTVPMRTPPSSDGEYASSPASPTPASRVVMAVDDLEDESLRYVNHCAYGAKAAFSMSLAKSRETDAKPGFYTVLIEAAGANGGNVIPRTYDWENRISIMLTKAELVAVAAVFYGYLRECSFSSHGQAHDKGFFMERKDGGIIVRMNATGKSHAVKIPGPDMFYMGSLLTRQLLAEYPWMDSEMLVALLRGAFPALPVAGEGQPAPAPQTQGANQQGAASAAAQSGDVCSSCGKAVDQKVKDYSTKRFGRALCLPCQKSAQ